MDEMLEIRFEEHKLKQLERQLRGIPRAMPKVMSRALNRTATEARTKTARELAGRTGLKVKDTRDRITLQRASYSSWRSAIRISRRRIPIYRFGARQTRKGVTYKSAGRKRILIRSAFITTMPSGHTGVFKRKFAGRLPIVELRGPSMGQVFVGAQDMADRIFKESQERLAKNVHDQVQLILARRVA